MPKPFNTAIAATCLVTVIAASSASAQDYQDHHHYDHGGYDHRRGFYQGSHVHVDRVHNYGHHVHQHDHNPGFAIPDLACGAPREIEIYSTPFAEQPLDDGYGGIDRYCPNSAICPLEYQTPGLIVPSHQQRFTRTPNQIENPSAYSALNNDSHAGHDHENTPPSDQDYIQPPDLSPSYPTTPSQRLTPKQRMVPQPDVRSGEPLRMDAPPPPTVG